MVVTVSTSETSVSFYHTTRRNIPKDSHISAVKYKTSGHNGKLNLHLISTKRKQRSKLQARHLIQLLYVVPVSKHIVLVWKWSRTFLHPVRVVTSLHTQQMTALRKVNFRQTGGSRPMLIGWPQKQSSSVIGSIKHRNCKPSWLGL
jgi:hypothetical protein